MASHFHGHQAKYQQQLQSNHHAHQQKKRKMNLMPIKLNRRRFYLCLKVMLLFVVFGLYFVLLLRESMTAFSTNRIKSGGGKNEAVSCC